MVQNYKFAVDSIELKKINPDDFPEQEFAIMRLGFLSTKQNCHGLKISESVLREYASSVLGKWLVADMTYVVDANGHTENQKIVGIVDKNQDVVFVADEADGTVKASVDVVVSKIYAKDFVKIFDDEQDSRAVSVEMTVTTPEDDPNTVESFNIMGVTVLGRLINPSCPDADLTVVRFSTEKAEAFYQSLSTQADTLGELKRLASVNHTLEEPDKKAYKVDKSKKAMSDSDWGDVDKAELRTKVVNASNASTLVNSVYMLVEAGWEQAPSEHLKYPVMEFKGNTLVYNRNGLSSALGYARKENETSVVNKILKIYKNLGLNDDGKEDDVKMAKDVEFAAVDIGNMWGMLYDVLRAKYPEGEYGSIYRIEDIYEEDNQKFAIIRHRNEDALYRLDFSLTEDGLTVSDEIVKCNIEIVETDTVRKFAEPDNAEEYRNGTIGDDKKDKDTDDNPVETKKTYEELEAECARLSDEITQRDNIIMDKDAELDALRQFKAEIEDKQKMLCVDTTMKAVEKFMDKETAETARQEGMACGFSEIDAWANRVKASVTDKVLQGKEVVPATYTQMSAPKDQAPSGTSVWDRI